jgi:tetraacyldisaccharide 4'-kinase
MFFNFREDDSSGELCARASLRTGKAQREQRGQTPPVFLFAQAFSKGLIRHPAETRNHSSHLITGYLEGIISKEYRGVFPAIFRFGLLLISWIYLLIMKLRRWLYNKHILHSKRLSCKVISVGNVVAGGSGKTPTVIAIAKAFKEHTNLNLAVLSRGYLSGIRGPAVVSDGENIHLNPEESGDEPYILSDNLTGIPVLIGRDRYKTGRISVRKWDSDIIILDDGFQHLRLARDVDIIVMDSTKPFGLDHTLPRGYLRETLSTLGYADLILLTRVDQCDDIGYVRNKISQVAPLMRVFESIYQPCYLRDLNTDQFVELNEIKGKSVLAVCGIANPESFKKTLQSLNTGDIHLLPFPDHHNYPPSSIEAIRRKVVEYGVDMVICTEKDAPKLDTDLGCPVLALIIEIELINADIREIVDLIQQKIAD